MYLVVSYKGRVLELWPFFIAVPWAPSWVLGGLNERHLELLGWIGGSGEQFIGFIRIHPLGWMRKVTCGPLGRMKDSHWWPVRMHMVESLVSLWARWGRITVVYWAAWRDKHMRPIVLLEGETNKVELHGRDRH